MNKTYTPNHKNIERNWHLLDAEGKILGRLATEIAEILMGKNKPIFTNNIDTGDSVVVINAKKIEVTGNKMLDKVYYKHTGYPGGIREETLEKLFARKPTEVIKKAVYGMLPKNKLRDQRIKRLFIYADETHPHQAQIKQ